MMTTDPCWHVHSNQTSVMTFEYLTLFFNWRIYLNIFARFLRNTAPITLAFAKDCAQLISIFWLSILLFFDNNYAYQLKFYIRINITLNHIENDGFALALFA